MSEDQLEVLAERAATKAVEKFHSKCSFPADEREKLHILASNSTRDSAYFIATTGKRAQEAGSKFTVAVIWVVIIGAATAITYPVWSALSSFFKGGVVK
jgi:hypothetical protein